jgi:hypothetical protein
MHSVSKMKRDENQINLYTMRAERGKYISYKTVSVQSEMKERKGRQKIVAL